MRQDFDAIPDPEGQRGGLGSMLARMYRDIGLAAVADALGFLTSDGLLTAEFDLDLAQCIERGEYYLIPLDRPSGSVGFAA
jgi:hypothetical protein